MLGLIMKDFIQLKRIMKALGGVALIYIVMAIVQKSDDILITLGVIACTLSVINSLAMDERSKWNEYALTLSFDRTKLVVGKYAMLAIMSVTIAVVTMLVDALLFGMGRNVVVIGVGIIISSLLSTSVVLPFMYKYGIEKGRYVLLAIVMIPFVTSLALDSMGVEFPVERINSILDSINKAPWLLMIGTIALVFASMFSSVLICKKKEY